MWTQYIGIKFKKFDCFVYLFCFFFITSQKKMSSLNYYFPLLEMSMAEVCFQKRIFADIIVFNILITGIIGSKS